ncbi:ATP-binding cassette domain-containing protein [Roseateles sp. BYS180W]|uniref:ATP-binding cassette domain-containing protein n=1 Tax=Roseateles rivi TaxID=3299028 RepID=A0ABW7FXQ1_9BURK
MRPLDLNTPRRWPLTPLLLQCREARLRLGAQPLGPINLSLQQGERVAVLGPSGAGKSTLLKLLAAELSPASGTLQLHDRTLARWPLAELARQRAVMPQSHEVAFGLPVALVIALGRVALRHDPQREAIVAQAAASAQAQHLLERRFDTLSGGEKARVQLARVLAQLWDCQGGLLLVDEPLAALDPGLQWQLMDTLQHYARERQHAVVAVLHDINQALNSFERLWLMQQGQLVADLPATPNRALPLLEALYGLPLCHAYSAEGESAVVPALQRWRATRQTRSAACAAGA